MKQELNRKCAFCEVTLVKATQLKFCSLSCGRKYQIKNAPLKPIFERSCLNCFLVFELLYEKDRKKFCTLSCSAKYNNSVKSNDKKENKKCLQCDKSVDPQRIFCSHNCRTTYNTNKIITDWLNNLVSGLTVSGVVTPVVKQWLRNTRGDQCEKCGWKEINPTTGKVPVVADHIDGNWKNNRPENLQLICPNCDSIQSTYKSLNKGRGRSYRKTSMPD